PPRILHAARRPDRAGCVRPDCGTRYRTRAAPLAPPLRRHSLDAPFRQKSGCWSGSCLISGAGQSSEWRSGRAAARPGILLGWGYARILIRSGKLWGGKAPLTATDFDDFVLWVTLGIILGGRIGYV